MIAQLLHRLDELVWGPWLLALLLGTGTFLMLKLHFLPLRRLGYALRCIIGADAAKENSNGRSGGGNVSPFASLTTELAATIGIGNIVGVATAMVLGGPGALFWMMAASVPGLALKLVESTLSVKYRERNARGELVGGPMYTLRNAFPLRGAGKLLGACYALLAVFASFGMGNMTQANSIADACLVTFGIPKAQSGLIFAIITILVILGGIKAIGGVTRVMVPLMGGFYLLGTLWVILHNLAKLPQGLMAILVMAFAPEAVTGGILGSLTSTMMLTMGKSLRYGVSRGVFSNEAGLGAGGITAAAADTDDYIRQGYISMTGVFFDTIVICLMSGLAFASSGLVGTVTETGEPLTGTALTIAVFAQTFGVWGARFVSVSILLFALATIIAWAYQGEKAFEYLTGGRRSGVWYRFVYALLVLVGAVCSLEVVWDFSDICNGLMAVPNLLCVLALSCGKNGICGEIRRG
ncbi:MAG: amino acid carrier protein [Butyrivibrio sp.]|nr:amino acid carrier protein [Muribaculum sp.]MCM1553191.1 amino acid carrier protein [Butyrivibrio sp.]